ncbi:phosphotransferase [Agromyces sp. MMS24-K17]|uniref:phosphotransferase n=1 Tax=Agromyces sp. MMS24-K17 TaxID=3372850 RepID=UPI0037542DDA
MGDVFRIGDTVRRNAGEWTPAVHRLLRELRSHGVDGVPEPLGTDDVGHEILTFIAGENLASAPPATLWSEQVLHDAGVMLRRIHDASVGLVDAGLIWRSPTRHPVEVICHNDFATYNLIVRGGSLAGVIDFDFAAPGPRVRDLAYLAYRLVPYAEDSPEASGLDRDARLRLLLDAYGTDASPRRVLKAMSDYLGELESFTRARAAETDRTDLLDHAAMYRRDADRFGGS